MFSIITGESPFEAYALSGDELRAVLTTPIRYTSDSWNSVSEHAMHLCQNLLVVDPSKRLTAEECWVHPFFNGVADQLRELLPKETGAEILKNLQNFSNLKPLQRLTNCYITGQMLSKTQPIVEFITILFCILDTSGKAALTKEQIQAGFVEYTGAPLSEEELDSLFKNVDLEAVGTIKFSEFQVAGAGANVVHTDKMLQTSFDVFDLNQDGSLSKEELTKVMSLRHSSKRVHHSTIDQVFGDKSALSFDDFKKIVAN